MQVIYRLTSPSGAVYIGQTKNLSSRLSTYRTLKCQKQPKLYNSLRKYGFDNHTLYIVHRFPYTVSQDIIDQFEHDVIGKHKHMMRCEMLNLTDGGRGNAEHSPKRPQLISRPDVHGERHKLAKLTEEDVKDIRAFYRKGERGRGIRIIAQLWHIDPKLAYNIVNHKTWKHIWF